MLPPDLHTYPIEHVRTQALLGAIVVGVCALLSRLHAADDVFITEFLAGNPGPVLDEDGDTSDWVELYNRGTHAVNLENWFLTDKPSDLRQWRFPATNLPPNAYLLVFASGKDRRVPGAPLHTSFQLKGSGEYLALVQPNGIQVVSGFAPTFPPQIDGISYGLPVQPTVTSILASGALARVLVPAEGTLGEAWTLPGFDDSAWLSVRTGVGYETEGSGPFVPSTLADSVAGLSGSQGQGNWYYGYWDKTSDADKLYAASEFMPFPDAGGSFSASNFWTGTNWAWFDGDPPLTQITGAGGQPAAANGNLNRATRWAVRRYIADADGAVYISGQVMHTSDWVYVTATGVAADSVIYLFLTGPGEGYIDDMRLVAGSTPGAGTNLLSNGDFETTGITPWKTQNLPGTAGTTTAVKHSGSRSLRLVFTAAGSPSASLKQTISPTLRNGQTYTLSYWYLPVTNSAPLVVQSGQLWINTTPSYCGDGTIARIFVDGAPVLQQPAWVSSSNYSLVVPVTDGTRIDFALDPGAADNDACDATTFTALIQTAPSPVVVADSVADWSLSGTQGEKNWWYGYYDQTADTLAGYQANDFQPFPRGSGPRGPGNYWDGAAWDWWNGDPPLDEIGERIMNPNGSNNGNKHWVIRRWRSTVSGTLAVDWTLAKTSRDGAGVTGRVLHNGALEDSATLPGVTVAALRRSLAITNVQVGDAIDLAVDPLGSSGDTGDIGDRSLLSAVIRGRPSLTSQIGSNIEGAMKGVNASAYLRVPFTVANPAAIEFLTLRLKYDDGWIAYLNGQPVARANAPLLSAWNSSATAAHSDAAAQGFEEFNLTAARSLLQPGTNVLALHGLNRSAADSDFLLLPELVATQTTLDPASPCYFAAPTPGAPNGSGTASLGPLILGAEHTPGMPAETEDLLVTARVMPTFDSIREVRLIYRTMYSNEVEVAMNDDGAHSDGAAGDGLFAATIPAGASSPGQMVRYYIDATDTRTNRSRFPPFNDPQNSPEYLGTVVINPALTNPLPVVHLFVQDPTRATNYSGTRASVFYDGEFYDNVGINLHGVTTPVVFEKRSMNIDLNSGHHFRWQREAPRVDDFILMTTAADKAYVRQIMAYETFAAAGVPSFFCFPVRVQQNNALYGVMHLTEAGNADWLERVGLNPRGALYKMNLPLTNAYAGVAEKKTRKDEDHADLQALIDGCKLTGAARRVFLYDNVDIPEVVNFLATIQLVQNEDCCDYKNYYLYRDTEGTREWQMIPWDLDLTFGRVFTAWVLDHNVWTGGYYDTNIHWMNWWYTEERDYFSYIGWGNSLANKIFLVPETLDMFLRRWTTVQEEFLQLSNTHPLLLRFERRVDELTARIGPDAGPDLAQWGTWPPRQTQQQAAEILKQEYFARRRGWIFDTLRYENGGPYLGTQPSNAVVNFAAMEVNPASGHQAEEYIQLYNTNSYAVDISGWKITGAVDYTFRGGVVLPTQSALYVSPDVNAFRARTTGPRGGQGLFVQGNYKGELSTRGGTLRLVDKAGRCVSTTNCPVAPSLAQQYLRITEIMYHPAPPPGLAVSAEEFEFLEVKNIGPVTLSLAGVRFVRGVQFDFAGSQVTGLAPGESAVVVRNLAAFSSRYGSVVNVAGAYVGLLENQGEAIRVEDVSGEIILEFSYDPQWYPVTDGVGFSLVVVDENAPCETWGLKSSWRPGSRVAGSPSQTDPPPPITPGVLITEALTHTDPPELDAVEIYNPTAGAVNLNGWYLTDDFRTPQKFRIHDRPLLLPGGYALFDERDFNSVPGDPGSFSLNSQGDELYLFTADTDGNLTGYFSGFAFGAAENGVSFGRYVNSVGREELVAQIRPTLGGANSGPRVGPVVISEIHYHPPEEADGSDNAQDEFVELHNLTVDPVPFFDPVYPTHTWRMRGVADFDFPTQVVLGPGGFLVLVNFNPANTAQLAQFQDRFGVPAGVPVFGPYRGKLDNGAGSVKLFRPDAPEAGSVPYLLVDQVDYADVAPWPAAADGTGASLQRLNLAQYGNDPIQWTAAAPAPGAAAEVLMVPVIVAEPQDAIVTYGATAFFNIVAAGTAPLHYQWRFEGTNLPSQTSSLLVMPHVLPALAGGYSVVVSNSLGSVTSVVATLTLVDGDADGDGMSDLWELAHGLDPFRNDAGPDPDQDGMSNGQEFLSGTDPHDPGSCLKIDQLAADSSVCELSFLAISNRTYTVMYGDLPDGEWQRLADVPARATNRVEVVLDRANGVLRRFYRLVTPAKP